MRTDIIFLLKATCFTYIFSLSILPILCGSILFSLMLNLVGNVVRMGCAYLKPLVNGNQTEQQTSEPKTSAIVTQQPAATKLPNRSAKSRFHNIKGHSRLTTGSNMMATRQVKKNARGKKSMPQDVESKAATGQKNLPMQHGNQSESKILTAYLSKSSTSKMGELNAPPQEFFDQADPKTSNIWKEVKLGRKKLKHGNSGYQVDSKRPKLSTETQQVSTKILLEFEKCLREDYEKRLRENKMHHFEFDMCTLNSSGKVDKRSSTLSELFPTTPNWKMLVYGYPRFGKSQLCQDLTSIWVSLVDENVEGKYPTFKNFRILIWIQLGEENIQKLQESIVERCYNMLSGKSNKEEFEKAWNSQMVYTLIILDGYDCLNPNQRSLVRVFIKGNQFFDGASFLLTSRPNPDTQLGSMFHIQANICGLSETMLSNLTKERISKKVLLSLLQASEVKKLYGTSPLFAEAIAEVFNCGEKPQSLYELLDKVMSTILQKATVGEHVIHAIGQFLFRKLKRRQFIFEEEELQKLVRENWTVIRTLDVFIQCPVKHEEPQKLVVSHLLIMLYFCIKYLRKEWNKLSSHDHRKAFLRHRLSFEDSSEVHISCSETNKWYFVGLIPEIVYDINANRFQMITDVTDSGLSSAFEAQSLLLRADEKRLGMFGIAKVADIQFEESFADYLNILDFSDLTIDRSFFRDIRSALQFMKLAVVDEEKDKLALLSVASSNESGRIQDIFVEFKSSEVERLHLFLQKFAELFLGPCELESTMQGPELVMFLVLTAISSSQNCYSRLTLGSNTVKAGSLVTWEVVFDSQNKPSSCMLYAVGNQSTTETYNSDESQQLCKSSNTKMLIDRMKKCVENSNEVYITIYIKT